jgi:arylsulfatase
MSRIWQEPLEPCAIRYGWTQPSMKGIGAFGRRSEVDVEADSTDYNLLILTVKAFPNPDPQRRQKMRVFLNGRKLGTREIPREWATVGLPIPEGRLRPGSNKVSFSFAYHSPAKKHPGKRARDYRRIAANLKALGLARTTETELSQRTMKKMLARASSPSTFPVRVFDEKTGRFRVEMPGSLVLPVEVSPSSEHLTIEMSAASGIDIDRTEILATIVNLSSGNSWAPPLPEWRSHGDSGVMAAGTIPIGRCAGAPCVVILKVHAEPPNAAIEIAQPQQLAGSEGRNRDRLEAAAKGSTTTERPDIVLITLDAARPDHFSVYGYDRLTTPNIDRLARDSLVFHNAFALAPYTLASVPTMVTGRSFLDHGVTHRGQALWENASTLAGQLREAGYRTVGFSTNPHNSRASGTDQGYDEFYELWTEIEGRASSDPRYITERALETIERIDPSQPLHLQLHYMPPHAPYNPAPEFDVFSDPAYEGPCDGWHRTIHALDAGRREAGDGCLDQVVALYDGGLFAADHWVGQFLDALRARPRWRNTVVLVTADHGDAFLEHGRMGHNSSVYDEMLRVPFILRLPEDAEEGAFASNLLVTLEDIVPTLLAAAGLEPAAPVTGMDVSRARDNAQTPPRFFIAQTTGYKKTYALRTPRFKIILPSSGHGRLFDLSVDAGELKNLSFDNRPVFVALGQLLTSKLSNGYSTDISPVTAEIPEEDRKMLEALGYAE